MISLRRAHHDHSALGVADAASAAVDRSLRIVHHSVAELGDRADLLKAKGVRGQLNSVQKMAQWAWDEVKHAFTPRMTREGNYSSCRTFNWGTSFTSSYLHRIQPR